MNKFKVGDKVRRIKSSNMGVNPGDIGTVTQAESGSNYVRLDIGQSCSHAVEFLELVEPEMFDMKTKPWFIDVRGMSVARKKIVTKWLQGQYEDPEFAPTDEGVLYYTNLHFGNNPLISDEPLFSRNHMVFEKTKKEAKEIKLEFSIGIGNVIWPEVESPEQKEAKEIRLEMENLAERLKKLESST